MYHVCNPQYLQFIIQFNNHKHKTRFHEGKNFLCNTCGIPLSSKTRLRIHIKNIHLQGDLFECDECNYTARDKGSVKKHKNAKHLGITYDCHLCEYKASYRKRKESYRQIQNID